MKTVVLLCAVFWVSPAFATVDPKDEPKDVDRPEPKDDDKPQAKGEARPGGNGEAEPEAKAGARFSLISRECKAEDPDELETTPGSPPLDVDDPATPGCNGWEINIVTTGELGKNMSWETPLFDINYGIGDNVQLKFEIPYEITTVDGAATPGVGRTEIGLKYRFLADESRDLGVAVYPQVEFPTPGVDGESEGVLTKLPVLLSTRIAETTRGPVMITANVGYNMSTQAMSENYLSAAFGIGFPLTSKVALMIESSTEQAINKNMENVREGYFKANVGALGRISDHLLWFGSVGQTFAASEQGDSSHTCLTAGIRILAGGP